MASLIGNLVLENANNPGTGTISLAGAPAGRRAFSQVFSSAGMCFYFLTDGSQAEWGIGTFTPGSPNTLARTVVKGNTAGTTAALGFTGAVLVYNEVPAEFVPYFDASGNFTVAATLNFTATSGNLVASQHWAMDAAGNSTQGGNATVGGAVDAFGSVQGATIVSLGGMSLPVDRNVTWSDGAVVGSSSDGHLYLGQIATKAVSIAGDGSVGIPGNCSVAGGLTSGTVIANGNVEAAGAIAANAGLIVVNQAAFSCPLGSNPAGTDTSGLTVNTDGSINSFGGTWFLGNTGGTFLQFLVTTGGVGSIAYAGGGQIVYNITSDRRAKLDKGVITGALDRMSQASPRRIVMLGTITADNPNGVEADGFIADEIAGPVPESVMGEAGATKTYTNVVVNQYGNPLTEGVEQADFQAEMAKGAASKWPVGYTWSASLTVPVMQQFDLSKVVPLTYAGVLELLERLNAVTARVAVLEAAQASSQGHA